MEMPAFDNGRPVTLTNGHDMGGHVAVIKKRQVKTDLGIWVELDTIPRDCKDL